MWAPTPRLVILLAFVSYATTPLSNGVTGAPSSGMEACFESFEARLRIAPLNTSRHTQDPMDLALYDPFSRSPPGFSHGVGLHPFPLIISYNMRLTTPPAPTSEQNMPQLPRNGGCLLPVATKIRRDRNGNSAPMPKYLLYHALTDRDSSRNFTTSAAHAVMSTCDHGSRGLSSRYPLHGCVLRYLLNLGCILEFSDGTQRKAQIIFEHLSFYDTME